MTYDDATQAVEENMHLIGRHAIFSRSEYLIQYLIIVPSRAEVDKRLEIVNEWLDNGFDNGEAIFSAGFRSEMNFDVIVVAQQAGVSTYFDLRDYPKENPKFQD
jgi:hypothetical protein